MIFSQLLANIRSYIRRTPGTFVALFAIVLTVALTLSLSQLSTQRAVAAPPRARTAARTIAVPKPAAPGENRLSFVSSPNPNYRASNGRQIDTVVIHFTSGINVDRSRWDDPQLAMQILKQNHVSAHYLVARDGTVYKLVDEKNVAWHAGGSIMPSPDNRRNVNSFSIGIENIATSKSGFTEAEYRSLASLVESIRSRYPIKHVVGHDEIAGQRTVGMGLRRDVKVDPGPLFDWSRIPGR